MDGDRFGTLLSKNCLVGAVMAVEDFQEREIWQRLEQGRKVKAAQGGYAGYGSPAFGQRAIDGELIEHPTEQQVIEIIRRHHKSGKSLQQVADWLNQSGYKTKRGQQWQRISVKRVLDRLYGRTSRFSDTGLQTSSEPLPQNCEPRET
jgi:DNA invertase Pin-like site-specific DNA recombinase